MSRIARLVVFVLVLFWPLAAAAASAGSATGAPVSDQDLLRQATDSYRQALKTKDREQARVLYRNALVRYRELVRRGAANGPLYANIGAAWLGLGEPGHALVNLRRAQGYLPENDAVRAAIAAIRAAQGDRFPAPADEDIVKTLFFWHYDMTLRARLLWLAAANAVFWGLLAMRLVRPWPTVPVLALAAILALAPAVSVAVELASGRQPGVIVAQEVTARRGADTAYGPSFDQPLHAGLEFTLIEERDGWYHIALADGHRCWVPAAAAELVWQKMNQRRP